MQLTCRLTPRRSYLLWRQMKKMNSRRYYPPDILSEDFARLLITRLLRIVFSGRIASQGRQMTWQPARSSATIFGLMLGLTGSMPPIRPLHMRSLQGLIASFTKSSARRGQAQSARGTNAQGERFSSAYCAGHTILKALRENQAHIRTKCEQCRPANPYPRHAPCLVASLPARIAPRAGAADGGRCAKYD